MITLDELKALLGVTGAGEDAYLTLAEAASVAFLEEQAGRHFGGPTAFVERFTGTGSERVWLREIPLADPVLTIEEHDGTAWVVVDAAQYELERPMVPGGVGELVHPSGGWARGRRYRANYSAGYPVTTAADSAGGVPIAGIAAPPSIRKAVFDLVNLARIRKDKAGIQSENIGGYSYTLGATYAFAGGDLRLVPGLESTLQAWKPRGLRV